MAMPSGGTITTNGTKLVHTFISTTAVKTFVVPDGCGGYAEVLVVAGGGGAGAAQSGGGAGGGGAGGLIYNASFYIESGSYSITIGAGGNGGTVNGVGQNGGDSVFSSITTHGGGGGGGGGNAGTTGGQNGGSGGGAGYKGYTLSTVGTGIVGEGNDGGNNGGAGGAGGGGGGGATAAGAAPTNIPQHNQGVGGAGYTSTITGSSITYAKGGNGGGTDAVGAAGTPNTGNGGCPNYGATPGLTGGSGIVIISYEPSIFAAQVTEDYLSGGILTHKFR